MFVLGLQDSVSQVLRVLLHVLFCSFLSFFLSFIRLKLLFWMLLCSACRAKRLTSSSAPEQEISAVFSMNQAMDGGMDV